MKRHVLTLILIMSVLPVWALGARVSGTALAANVRENVAPAPLNAVGGPVGQNGANWALTFNDEFDGSSLDRNKWRTDYWNGGNGELQEYVNDDSHNNYPVQNGFLNITARKEYYNGKSYTSGVISTNERFYQKYGFFEIRAKLPAGKGLWPAFWLMPNPSGWPPEIDSMENLGNSTVYMTLHYSGGQSQSYYSTNVSSAYHTYGVNWQPGFIAWYVDGVERKRFTDTSKIPSGDMFIIANLAVGGSWPGNPDSSTVFPAIYSIDYIRAWRYVSSPAPTATQLPAPTATQTLVPTATATRAIIPTATQTQPPAPTATQPSVSSTSNLIQNASFETSGLSSWDTRNDLGASFVQDTTYHTDGNYSFKATLPQANSSQPWVVALQQRNLSMVAGRNYTLSFYSEADAARTLKVIIQNQNSPYTEYFNKSANITTNWVKYTYTFQMPATTSSAMLNFNLATQTGQIWIDQVTLCEGTSACDGSVASQPPAPTATNTQPPPPTATATNTPPPPPTATATNTPPPPPTATPTQTPASSASNMIRNGSFETGELSPWATRNDLGATFVLDTVYHTDGLLSFKATLPQADSSQPWVVALQQNNLSIIAGKKYTLSFYSGADAARTLKVIIQNQNSPYTEYFNKSVKITENWVKYVYTFRSPVTINSAMLNFNLATQTGKIWLDQVSLCEGTSACN